MQRSGIWTVVLAAVIAFAATGVEAEVNQWKQIAAKQNIHVN